MPRLLKHEYLLSLFKHTTRLRFCLYNFISLTVPLFLLAANNTFFQRTPLMAASVSITGWLSITLYFRKGCFKHCEIEWWWSLIPISTGFVCLKEYFLFVKITPVQEPFPLKQVLYFINFMKPLAFVKTFRILSVKKIWRKIYHIGQKTKKTH